MDVCKLCLLEKKLSLSHVLPRSFIKSAKANSPQLIKMNISTGRRPLMSNADFKERLLCAECEELLNANYEASQIAFLRRYKEFQTSTDRVTFTSFQSRPFYLLWLSILWRASVSTVEPFSEFNLGEGLNELMRLAIFHKTVDLIGLSAIDFVSIGLLKLAPDDVLTEETLPLMLSNIYPDEEGRLLYLFVEGWCICYVRTEKAKVFMPPPFGRIKDSRLLRVPVRQAAEVPEIAKIFEKMGLYAEAHNGWRRR